VKIKDGPFSNLIGILEHEISDSDRVSILLTTISYQARVVVDKRLMEGLNQA
jgi:hypothetical protein